VVNWLLDTPSALSESVLDRIRQFAEAVGDSEMRRRAGGK
jgi:hypothetical protein